jgi:hypothetical protein
MVRRFWASARRAPTSNREPVPPAYLLAAVPNLAAAPAANIGHRKQESKSHDRLRRGAGLCSVRDEHRQREQLKQRFGHPAEQGFAETGMAIGASHDEVGLLCGARSEQRVDSR